MKKLFTLIGASAVSLVIGSVAGYSAGFAHSAYIWSNGSIPHKTVSRCAEKQPDDSDVHLTVDFRNHSIYAVTCTPAKK